MKIVKNTVYRTNLYRFPWDCLDGKGEKEYVKNISNNRIKKDADADFGPGQPFRKKGVPWLKQGVRPLENPNDGGRRCKARKRRRSLRQKDRVERGAEGEAFRGALCQVGPARRDRLFLCAQRFVHGMGGGDWGAQPQKGSGREPDLKRTSLSGERKEWKNKKWNRL